MNALPSLALQHDVVLVTGASGAIGRAVVTALRGAGARVVATDIAPAPDPSDADLWLTHDVTSAADWARVVAEIDRRFGRLDGLVNNAAVCAIAPIADTTLDVWRRVQAVNVEGVVFGLQAALPLLCRSGRDRPGGSSVVNLSSTGGLRGSPFAAAYCASKGAVKLLTKSVAKEWARLGHPVRVNSLHPGSVDTEMMGGILARTVELGQAGSIDEARAGRLAANPLGRMARTHEIAGGVVFLCSPAASYMTGAELVIDGGLTA